jgi:hypothetical protein
MIRPGSAPIWTICHVLSKCFVECEHAMGAAIEDVVMPCRRLLKRADSPEAARNMRRHRPDRTQGVQGRSRPAVREGRRRRLSETQNAAARSDRTAARVVRVLSALV